MKSGVLAGVFGALFQLGYLVGYLALGTVQLFAIFQGMIEIWDPSPLLAGFIGLLLAYIPIVGTVLGFFGAVEGWGLSYPLAALIFFFPLVLMIGIFSGVCLAGGLGSLSAKGKKIFPKGRLRAVASTLGKGFLGIGGLIVVGLGVLATVESGVLGKDTRVFLFVVATISILLGAFEYFHSSNRKVYVPVLILGLGIYASVPVAFTRIEIEKNNSTDGLGAGYEINVKEEPKKEFDNQRPSVGVSEGRTDTAKFKTIPPVVLQQKNLQQQKVQTGTQVRPEDYYRLGIKYYHGDGVRRDSTRSASFFRLAAERGHVDAQVKLATQYFDGDGVSNNYAEAAKWFGLAAEQGEAGAQLMIGTLYSQGRGVSKNFAEAAKWYRLAAEQGHAGAQSLLGILYAQGAGVVKDSAESAKWFRLAAEQGEAEAQRNLALYYYTGDGVPRDVDESLKWFQLAAEQGHPEAQYILGLMNYEGEGGLRKDFENAVYWFQKSGKQGHGKAQYMLGLMYYRGEGVIKNTTLAFMCFDIAASKRNEDAAGAREALKKEMTIAEITEAQRLSREWQQRNSLD